MNCELVDLLDLLDTVIIIKITVVCYKYSDHKMH